MLPLLCQIPLFPNSLVYLIPFCRLIFFASFFGYPVFHHPIFCCYHPKHPNRCWPVGFRKAILSSTSFCLMATQKPWKPHWADHPYSMCSVHLSCCDKIPQHWDRFGRTQLAPLHCPTSRIVPSRLWMMELQTRSNNKAKGCFETWLQLNHHWQKQIAKRYQEALIKPRILLPPDTSTESWEIGKLWPWRSSWVWSQNWPTRNEHPIPRLGCSFCLEKGWVHDAWIWTDQKMGRKRKKTVQNVHHNQCS